ncbi:MAG TPA: ankyrin repeat domain-containing protein [Bryobacteraceae bacterium]|nr:ankyrin repeat domain-containing protein [Bryobacteraceae bacterium]
MKQTPALFETMGGTRACRKLSRAFYARVERDPLLRPLFPGTTFKCAIDAFSSFLVQFLGGPGEASQLRSWVSLRESHQRFPIDQRHRDAWLGHMIAALEDAGIEEPARAALRGFFEVAGGYLAGAAPGGHRLSHELARRWTGQRKADDAIAAIGAGDTARAIRLAAHCPRALLPGLLARMIQALDAPLLDFVCERVAREPELVRQRYWGRTLLHAAAGAGSLRAVDLFLRLGADPNALDGGRHTPLYSTGNECAGAESAEVVRALVRAGARLDACDGVTGATPLHMAARRGNAVVARALLECGADIEARDRRGDTPLQRARNCKKAHVAELLQTWRPSS